MKKYLTFALCICFIFSFKNSSAQGWVAQNTTTLVALNSSSNLTPLNLGIGVLSPTAQFHTTGTVRFAGVTQNNTFTKVVVQDANGNLFWRDASTLGATNAWLLSGNSGTNPASNFIGTIDNQRLVFRTNNTEKVTILSNGNLGIGLSSPIRPLQVDNKGVEDNNAAITGSSPSMYFSSTATLPSPPYTTPIARIGLATRTSAFLNSSSAGDFILHAFANGSNLLFGTGVDGANNGIERMRITSTGRVGINTISPSSTLHVNGTVRFENLTNGTGAILVVDASGNVFKASTNARTSSDNTDELQSLRAELDQLRQELNLIKMQIADLKVFQAQNSTSSFEVSPNPSRGEVVLNVFVPAAINQADVLITDVNGTIIKRFTSLKAGANKLLYNHGLATSGFLFSTLILDGKAAAEKKIVVLK